MLDPKVQTLLAVVETGSFTRAAAQLSLTQPAVSHHIAQLEQELDIRIFLREKGRLSLTREGKIVVRCARRLNAMYEKLHTDLADAERNLTRLRVGITHTAESNLITEVLARFSHENSGILITITTDTINNLYDALDNYELDLAVVEGKPHTQSLNSLMLDTD